MHLTLIRIYGNVGTNGYLICNKKVIAKTIELPWKQNRRSESCIPEGVYTLRERYSPQFGRHLEVVNVPNRDLILFHPANDARRELRGCIAPVTELVGPGLGINSRPAMRKLMDLIIPILDNNECLTLKIQT
jgi:hypothetical protein